MGEVGPEKVTDSFTSSLIIPSGHRLTSKDWVLFGPPIVGFRTTPLQLCLDLTALWHWWKPNETERICYLLSIHSHFLTTVYLFVGILPVRGLCCRAVGLGPTQKSRSLGRS